MKIVFRSALAAEEEAERYALSAIGCRLLEGSRAAARIASRRLLPASSELSLAPPLDDNITTPYLRVLIWPAKCHAIGFSP
jgi:hypothetical protein